MEGGAPTVVGPLGEQVAQVDDVGAVGRQHRPPLAVGTHDLEAGDLVGVEHGDDAVVGVGTHALLALDRVGGAGLALVADHPHDLDRVLAPLDEELLGHVEGDGEDAGDLAGQLGDGGVVGVEPGSHRGHGLVGPHVGGEEAVALGDHRRVGLVDLVAGDVERLEDVGRGLDPEAVGERLRRRCRSSRG